VTRIGDLDQRVTLESPSRAPDGGGGADLTWQTVAEVWASVRPITGDERLRADQVAGRITHVVVIRRRSGVTPAMRFRSDERILEIVAVLDAPPRSRLRCLCEERYL
jgi:SPP1 family predicted phage head-tail adaptor